MNSFIETVKLINNNKDNFNSDETSDAESIQEQDVKAYRQSENSLSETKPVIDTIQHHCIRNIDFVVAFEKMSVKNLVYKNRRFDLMNFKGDSAY